jgi:hypothetical protein
MCIKYDGCQMLFDCYLFADYSGALSFRAQRRAIRLAEAIRGHPAALIKCRFTRAELVEEFVCRLANVRRVGMRVCFGQDHQDSVPFALAQELSISHLSWRKALRVLSEGSYGDDAPPLGHPSTFATRVK